MHNDYNTNLSLKTKTYFHLTDVNLLYVEVKLVYHIYVVC